MSQDWVEQANKLQAALAIRGMGVRRGGQEGALAPPGRPK